MTLSLPLSGHLARRPLLLLVALASMLAGCFEALDPELGEVLGLSSGTSFGECLGYCRKELILDTQTVTLVETWQPLGVQPERRRSIQLSSADWSRLQGLVDAAAIASVAGVHGCPDCADGGSEWIEVRTAQGVIRSTFEYGAVLQPIAGLQAEIRAIRARFN
jgi:hypothetical protein